MTGPAGGRRVARGPQPAAAAPAAAPARRGRSIGLASALGNQAMQSLRHDHAQRLADVTVVTEDPTATEHAARAYTIGREIHLGPGEFARGTASTDRLLAHEAVHVVQQTLGAVPGTPHADGPAAERDAERAADAVVAGRPPRIAAAVPREVQRAPIDPRENPDDFAPRTDLTEDQYVGILESQADWTIWKVEEFGGLRTVETRFPRAFAIIKDRVVTKMGQATWDLVYTNDHRIVRLVRNSERIKARLDDLLYYYEQTGQRAAAAEVSAQWDQFSWEYVDIAGYLVDNKGSLGMVELALDQDWEEVTDALEEEADAVQAAQIALEQERAAQQAVGEELIGTHVATIEEWGSDTDLELEKLLHPAWGVDDYFQGLAWARNSGRASAVIKWKGRFYVYELDDQFDTDDAFLIDDWVGARSEIVDTGDTPVGTTLMTSDGNFLQRPSGFQRFFGGRTAEIAEELERADQALLDSEDPEVDRHRLFEALLMDILMRNLEESEAALLRERDKVIDPWSYPQMPEREQGAALKADASALQRHMAWASRLADEIGDNDPDERQRREVELALAAIGRIHLENPAAAFLVETERDVPDIDLYRDLLVSKGAELVGDTAFIDVSASMDPAKVCWKVAGELDRRIANVRKIRKHFLVNPHDVLDLDPLHGEVLERFPEADRFWIELDLFFRGIDQLVSTLGMAALEIGLMVLGMATSGLTSAIALGLSTGIGLQQTQEAFEQAERLEAMSALDLEGGFQLATPDQASSARFWAYVGLGLTLIDLGGLAFSARNAARLRRVIADPDVAAVLKRSDQKLGDLARRLGMTEKQLVDRLRWARGVERAELLGKLRLAADPGQAGGRAGRGLDWPADMTPKQIDELREALLRQSDEGTVFKHVQKHARDRGIPLGLTEEDLFAIKAYIFDSPGLSFSQKNYTAWRRLARGVGTVDDLRFLQHEAAEISALRKLDPKFDINPNAWETWSAPQRKRWTNRFQHLYKQAHAEALDREYQFLANRILEETGVDVSRQSVAVADMLSPSGAPGRPEQFLTPDDVPFLEHRHFPAWTSQAKKPLDLDPDVAARLGLTPGHLGRAPTLVDVLNAVRRQPLDPTKAARARPTITLHHGTSLEGAAGIRQGVRVDVNSPHPGRTHFGKGFYLTADTQGAEFYARQTASPTMLSFQGVNLDDLGTILDITQGTGKKMWDDFLDTGVGSFKNRDLWRLEENRGTLFETFLGKQRLDPDVVIAPHDVGGGVQIVIRNQNAADVLSAHVDAATGVAP